MKRFPSLIFSSNWGKIKEIEIKFMQLQAKEKIKALVEKYEKIFDN